MGRREARPEPAGPLGHAGRVAAEALLRSLAHVPPGVVYRAGGLFRQLARCTRSRHVAERNLAVCLPELSPDARRAVALESCAHFARAVLEAPRLWSEAPGRLAGRVEAVAGDEVIADTLAAGRGVLLLVPHLGSWELMGLWCSARWPMTSLYRPQHPAVDRYIRRARERHGARLVPTTAGGVRALYEALSAGGLVGMLPDHVPRTGGVFAPFCGEPALTTTLPARLLARTGAAAVMGYALRLPGGRFRLRFERAPETLADPDPERAAAALNEAVARCIRMAPEQYLWAYKRFKARPPGAAPVY